jgi:mannosyltransferase
VAAATGLNCALGLYHLGTRSLWLDEGYTWLTSSFKVSYIWKFQHSDGGHLFLYYLLIHYLISWFGDSASVMRWPSVIAGAASVPLLFLLTCRLVADRVAGIYAAVLFAVSTPLVFWQQNAREYAFIVLLAVASTLLLVIAVQEVNRWALVGWAVIVVVACYSNVQAALLPAAQLLPVLMWPRAKVMWRPLAVVVGAAGIASVIPLLAANDNAASIVLTPPNGASVREVATFLASGSGSAVAATDVDYALLGLTTLFWAVAFVLLIFDLAHHGRTERNFGSALSLSWLIVPSLLSWTISETYQPIFSDRYLIVSLPAAAVVVAGLLARLQPRALGLYSLVYLTVFRFGVLIPTYDKPLDNFAGATHVVAVNARLGDCIVFYQDDERMLYDYYSVRVHATPSHPLPAQVLPYAPPGDKPAVIEYYSNIATLGYPSAIAVTARVCPRLWVLESHFGSPTGTRGSQQTYMGLEDLLHNLGAVYHPQTEYSFPGVELQLFDRR